MTIEIVSFIRVSPLVLANFQKKRLIDELVELGLTADALNDSFIVNRICASRAENITSWFILLWTKDSP